MGMAYTKVDPNLFKKIQINAGIVCKGFTPASGTFTDILSATSGGIQFASNPTYTDDIQALYGVTAWAVSTHRRCRTRSR